jgi:hypothetical protein
MIQITILSKVRVSHVEPLEPSQLADCRRQRRELVVLDLQPSDQTKITIRLPRVAFSPT